MLVIIFVGLKTYYENMNSKIDQSLEKVSYIHSIFSWYDVEIKKDL